MLKVQNRIANTQMMLNGKQQKSHTPSFGNKAISAQCLSKAEEILIENTLVKKHMGLFGKALNKLSETTGEIQNILFIGFGTAFVAPIFIAYNSLAKEDDRTKKYSAMRQPISAIISVATGLGVNYPVAKWMNKASAEGKLSTFDMTAKPSTDLIKASYNNILKKLSKSGEAGLEKLNSFDKKIYELIKNENNKTAQGFKTEFDNFQTFEKKVVAATSEKAADWLLNLENKDNLREMKVKDFLIKYLGFDQDVKDLNILNPDSSQTKFKDISALKFLKKMGIDDFNESKLRALLAKSIYSERFESAAAIDKDMAQQIFDFLVDIAKDHQKEFTNRDDLKKNFLQKYAKSGFTDQENKKIARIVELFVPQQSLSQEKITAKMMFKSFGVEKDIYSDPKLYNKKMTDFMLQMRKWLKLDADMCKETFNPEEFIKKVASKIAQETATTNAKALKAYSSLQGIILSLAILPFACGALNWSYPRIMEKFFPSLSGNTPRKNEQVEKGENK